MLQYLDTIIALAVVMLGLSLLITLLNQIVSSFLSFRAGNLRWGIQTMLSTLAPELTKKHIGQIANKILTEPVVSDSILAGINFPRLIMRLPVLSYLIPKWKLASAIGPDTLVRVLTNLSEGNLPYANSIREMLRTVDPAAIRKLSMAYAAFGTPPAPADPGGLASPLAPPPLASPPDATATQPDYSVQMDDLLKQLGNSAQQSVGKVEAWFNVTMNRVSQRFAMQIRIVTVIFAFVLAFGLHLDSVQLTNQLFKNPALRQKLVDSSGAMLNEAAAILGTDPSADTAPTTSPKVLKSKMEELRDKVIDKNKEGKPELLEAVPEFKNLAEAEKWLFDRLKDDVVKDQKRKSELEYKYKQLVISGLKEQARDVIGLLKDAGIEFAPRPLPKWNWLQGWREFFGWKAFFIWDNKRNLIGILLTGALLSLGAPFWFNSLKSLTNLRPLLATKQDEQKKEAAG